MQEDGDYDVTFPFCLQDSLAVGLCSYTMNSCENLAYADCATQLMRVQVLPLVRILLRPVDNITIYLFERFRVGFQTVKVKRSPTGSRLGLTCCLGFCL